MKFRYLALLLIILPLRAMSPEEKEYYTHKYAVPAELKEDVDALCDCYGIYHNSSMFFVKGELDRLKGMEIIRETAKKHQCDLIVTPEKYAHVHRSHSDHVFVLAKVVENSKAPFTLSHMQQICTVIRKANFWDAHKGNIIHTPEGKVAFIDTETRGFFNDDHSAYWADKYTGRIASLRRAKGSLDMTPEARTYVKQEIKNEQARESIHDWVQEELHKEQKKEQGKSAALQSIRTAYDAIKSRFL